MPGDPTIFLLHSGFRMEDREYLLKKWGLDKPVLEQYVIYIKNFFTGDLGNSFYYNKPVMEVLGEKIINSVFLMGLSIVIALFLGGLFGALLGWMRGGKIEKAGIIVALFLKSMPIFWMGIILLSVFSFWLRWFPGRGMHSITFNSKSLWGNYFSLDFLRHLFLPLLCAIFHYVSDPLMIMRSSILEVYGEDFIEMSKAKGLKDWEVLIKHGMRNAVLPLVTYSSLLVGFAFGGQLLLEVVFSWPGIGREMVIAVAHQDYPICQASFFLMAMVVVLMNFFIDISYMYLDPRIVYERKY